MRVKLSLEDSVRGIPKRSSDKKMNSEAQAYNRAMRDVKFNADKAQLEKDQMKLTMDRLMNEVTRKEITQLIGDLKGAMGMSMGLDASQPLPGVGIPGGELPGVGMPGGELPGVGSPEAMGMPPGGQGGPLPADMGGPGGMPQGMDPNMMMQG